MRRNNVAQKFNGSCIEGALLKFGVELILSQVLQDKGDMNIMFFRGFRVDENIIQVNYNEFIKVVGKCCS